MTLMGHGAMASRQEYDPSLGVGFKSLEEAFFNLQRSNQVAAAPAAEAPQHGMDGSEESTAAANSESSRIWRTRSLPVPNTEESTLQTVQFGRPGSLTHRILFSKKKTGLLSPWHDIPLHAGSGELNFVCLTPRGCWIEFESAEEEPFNPLRIRKREGMPSHFHENCHEWHLGYLPQTWVDPDEYDNDLSDKQPMRGGPLEVIAFGDRVLSTGSVTPVKILGAFALADSKRSLSWKLLAVAANEQKYASLSSLVEIQERLPGVLDTVQMWLLSSHGDLPDDGQLGQALVNHAKTVGQQRALRVMAESHASWQLYQSSRPEKSVRLRKFSRVKTAEELEKLWAPRLAGTSDISIPMCEPNAEGQAILERAWLDASYKDFWENPVLAGQPLLEHRNRSDTQESEVETRGGMIDKKGEELSPTKAKSFKKLLTSFKKVLSMCQKAPQGKYNQTLATAATMDALTSASRLNKLQRDVSPEERDRELEQTLTSEKRHLRKLKGSRDSFSSVSSALDFCSMTSGSSGFDKFRDDVDCSPKLSSFRNRAAKPPLRPSSPSQPLTPMTMSRDSSRSSGERRQIRFRVVKSVDTSRTSGLRFGDDDFGASRLNARRPPPLETSVSDANSASNINDLSPGTQEALSGLSYGTNSADLNSYRTGNGLRRANLNIRVGNSPTKRGGGGVQNPQGFRDMPMSLARTRSGPMDVSYGVHGESRRTAGGPGQLRRAEFGSADISSLGMGPGPGSTVVSGVERGFGGSNLGGGIGASRLHNGARRSPLYRELSLDAKLLETMLDSPGSEGVSPRESSRLSRRSAAPSPNFTITKGLSERLREKQQLQQQQSSQHSLAVA